MNKYRIRKYGEGPRRIFRMRGGLRVEEDFEEDLELWTPSLSHRVGVAWACAIGALAAGVVAYLVPAIAQVTIAGILAVAAVGTYQYFKRQSQNQPG